MTLRRGVEASAQAIEAALIVVVIAVATAQSLGTALGAGAPRAYDDDRHRPWQRRDDAGVAGHRATDHVPTGDRTAERAA